MNDAIRIYRAEILRAVLGPGAHAAQAVDLPRLNQFVERLAECEQAHAILRAKGYGAPGTPLPLAASEVPTNVRQVLRDLFRQRREPGAELHDLSEFR